MAELSIVWSPPPGKGRRRILGTVLADPAGEQMALVKLVASHGENAGGSGSPRVECWIALTRGDFSPAGVHRAGDGPWRLPGRREISGPDGPLPGLPWDDALRRIGRDPSSLWDPDASGWPTTLDDPRVVLPGDPDFPRRHPTRPLIEAEIAARAACPADEAWRHDAAILAFAPRRKAPANPAAGGRR